MESHETASMSPVSDDNKSRADQFLGSAQQSTDDDVLQASLTSEASSMDAVDEVSSVINDLTEDVPENNDSGDQVPDQDVIDHSGAVSFSTNQQGPVMSRKAAVPELYRLAALLGVKIELPLTLPHNPDATLMGLPAEVRIMIYELLLINPILGELASISKHDHYGAHQSYELHPAVIGVCKQVQTEATPILYGRNTFCVVCLPFPGPTWTMQEDLILSPFTRYSSYPPFPLPFSSQLPSVRDIKKWKVILSVRAWHDYESQPSCPFFEVCRAISRGHPTHVDIAIIPKGIEDGVFEYQNMEEALKPLGLLRHIENFQIRDTTPFEIPDIIDQDEDAIEFPSNMEDHAVLEVTLTLSAQSDDPVEKVFEMYGSLLRYAQSFEQLPQFKQEMALEEYCSQPAAIDFPDDSIEWDFLSEHLNPFKESGCNHPVEAALMLARTYADNEDGQQFKVERAAIIEYLEPQFQRVSAAASAVVGFVKEEKCRGGILDCCQATLSSDDEYATICATAMMLLEECDTTFRRDMSFHIKVKFRQFRSPFRRIYATTGVGHALMEDLNFALETRNYTGFVNFFKVAVDRLDNLFLEMLRARQDLFKWDVPAFNDRQCTIDPQIERSTENISWDDAGHPDESSQNGQDNDSDDGAAPESENGSHEDENANLDDGATEEDATSEAGVAEQASSVEDDGAQGGEVENSNHEDDDEADDHAEQDHSNGLSVEDVSESTEGRVQQEISGDHQIEDDAFEAARMQSEGSADTPTHDMSSNIQQFSGNWLFDPLSGTQEPANVIDVESEIPEEII